LENSAEFRAQIENAVESLIALLDVVDGDENLEPYLAGYDSNYLQDLEADTGDDEPYLSAGAYHWHSIHAGNEFTVDLELDYAEP